MCLHPFAATLFSATGTGNLGGAPNASGITKERVLNSSTVAEVSTPVDAIIEEKSQDSSSSNTITVNATSTPIENANDKTENVESRPLKDVPLAGEGDANKSHVGENENSLSTAGGVPTRNVNRWRHSTSDCLACVRTRPPSSHELREMFFAGESRLKSVSFCFPITHDY